MKNNKKSILKKKSKKKISKTRQLLNKKIKKNMEEWKKGRFSSREQALAVSYSQVSKENPRLSRFLKKKI